MRRNRGGKKLDNKHNKHRYVSKSVETSDKGKVMEPTVQTDTTIPNNKSGIIIRDNKNGTCMSTDVVMSTNKTQKCDKARNREDPAT